MKKLLLVTVALLSLCFEAKADKISDIDTIIEMNSSKEQVQKITDQILAPNIQMLKCSIENLSVEDEEQIKMLFSEFQNIDMEKALMQKFYNDNFTDTEISEILAFYQTDAGKKILLLQPKLASELSMIAISKLQNTQQKVQSTIMNIAAKYPKRNEAEARNCIRDILPKPSMN